MAQTDVGGWLQATWGEVLAEMNDLDGAIAKTRQGVEIGERGGDLAMLGWNYLCLIRTLFSRGDLTSAEEIIHKIEITARESFIPPWIMNLHAAWQGRIWLAQDKKEAAYLWAEERGLDAKFAPTYDHELEYLVLARILMAQKRLDEAIFLLQRMLESAELGRRTTRVIKILMLQALAYHDNGDTTRAMNILAQALSQAEPGGFIRTFVDEGPQMARLLYEALSKGIAPEYIQILLSVFPDAEEKIIEPSKAQAPYPELIEPLSEREIEVLQLISKGYTNPEIAARLYLSLNTVKVHTRNIYGKLDVHNRAQAIARAQALGLLEYRPGNKSSGGL
jgi:LuxR family maltose regulon positive regulatory protein